LETTEGLSKYSMNAGLKRLGKLKEKTLNQEFNGYCSPMRRTALMVPPALASAMAWLIWLKS
jgi:hypothetical protein